MRIFKRGGDGGGMYLFGRTDITNLCCSLCIFSYTFRMLIDLVSKWCTTEHLFYQKCITFYQYCDIPLFCKVVSLRIVGLVLQISSKNRCRNIVIITKLSISITSLLILLDDSWKHLSPDFMPHKFFVATPFNEITILIPRSHAMLCCSHLPPLRD